MRGRVFRNVATNWMAMVLNVLVGFVMMPFVVAKLGTEGYGFWALLQAVISYMFVLDFGVRSGLNRHLARLHARGGLEEAERVASTGMIVYALVGVLVVLAGTGLGLRFGSIFDVGALDEQSVFWSVMLMALSVGIRFPGAVFDAILTGVQRYDLMNCAHVTGLLVRTGLVVWALEAQQGVIGIAAATLVGTLVTVFVQWRAARGVWPTLRIKARRAGFDMLRMLATHSVFAYVLITATHVITESGTVIAGALLGSAPAAFYAIGVSLTSYATSVVSGISTTITPAASEREARGDLNGIKAICTTGTRFILLTGLPILTTFLLTGDLFVTLWIGPGYEATYGVLVWLSVAWAFNYVQSAAACVLVGLSRHRIAAMLVLVQAALSVGLGLAMAGRFGVGGVAAAVASVSVVMNTLVQRHALRELGMPARRFVLEGVVPPVLAGMPFGLVLYGLTTWQTPTSLLGYFTQVGLSVTAMAISAPWLALSRSERQSVAGHARRLLGQASLVLRNAGGRV